MTTVINAFNSPYHTDILNVIKTMMWCHGIELKCLKENPELPNKFSEVLFNKLQCIQNQTYDDIVINLVKKDTCCETMGRILTILRIKHENSKNGVSKTSVEWCKPKDLVSGKKCSLADSFKGLIKDAAVDVGYYTKCNHYDYTPGTFKLRDMKRVSDLTENMNEQIYDGLLKARKDNSFFNIQPDLKKWLDNKETPKFFLSVLAHDLTLQIIDNYLRNATLTETTFF